MARKINVLILRTAGTNCDVETAHAFSCVGASADFIHINTLLAGKKKLEQYHILALPGGFSYGDDIAAGKILANELRYKLKNQLENFIKDGKLIIGICNGFQILVKSGLLPGNNEFRQEASLSINDSAKFESRWVYLKSAQGRGNSCVWTKDLPEIIYLPVAHGEGKFIPKNTAVLNRLKKNSQVVFTYCSEDGSAAGYPYNPNGSVEHIAGICDETGRVLGLMPHPERHCFLYQHPRWPGAKKETEGDGLQIFRNGVEYAGKKL